MKRQIITLACVAWVSSAVPPFVAASQLSVPTFLPNGDLSISYSGTPDRTYVAEWADSLTPPVTWTPLQTNTADSCTGLVGFTDTPASSQRFYRLRYDSSAPIPLVYGCEHTGRFTPPPPLPTISYLPFIQQLPDPFMWADYSGRSTDFDDWKRRRAEIQAQVENYEIGPKPAVPPENITASYANGTLTVVVTRTNGGQGVLTLTSDVTIPSGSGPFPAIIGMALAPGGGTGSLPSGVFSNCIKISYLLNQVTTYDTGGQPVPHTGDPYYVMYPEYNDYNSGQYSAWAWGVSRLIDGLYAVKNSLLSNSLPIDLNHIAVTGCSYAGKMALFAGAMDERVALTIAQESGGGGATSWRYSHTEPAGSVESLENTSHTWFMDPMFQFGGENVYYLPEDHHMLNALCAPRALLVTGNTDFEWLSNPSCYVNSRATHEIYKTLGIGDRFGFIIDGGQGHCAVPASQIPAIQAFVDKFLFGNTNVNTDVTIYPGAYNSIDYAAWYQWWGTTNPVAPVAPTNLSSKTFEPECATVGTNWFTLIDPQASNGKYVTVNPNLSSIAAPPTNSADHVTITFSVTNSENVTIYGRCDNVSVDHDSFWVKMDDESWVLANGLTTTGWEWKRMGGFSLTAGQHTLTIAYRENAAKLDKISIGGPDAPDGMGEPAALLCP